MTVSAQDCVISHNDEDDDDLLFDYVAIDDGFADNDDHDDADKDGGGNSVGEK